MLSMISLMVAPFLRCSMPITWAILLPGRGACASGWGLTFFALGAGLAGVAFLVAFPFAGATRGFCGAAAGFLLAFVRLGFAGAAAVSWFRRRVEGICTGVKM